uniref:Uncharacterized protein n=1 Tax=Aegilops tauschii subsp. strangulata TaxID=200361 RepID=A0A453PS74_AEGTS
MDMALPKLYAAENGGRGGVGPWEDTSACCYEKKIPMVQRISSGDSRQVWQKLCVSTQLKKGSESKLTSESISNATTTKRAAQELDL